MKRRIEGREITVTCLNCGWDINENVEGAIFECPICLTDEYLQDFDGTLERY